MAREVKDDGSYDYKKGIIDYDEINRKFGLNNIETKNRPLLTINAWCHSHIRALHKKYPSTEWLAWCKIENLWNGHFVMTDMIHPEQECSGANVETTDEWMERIDNYLLENDPDNMGKWNCVLHSHHSMWAFWSGTDDDQRKKLNDGRRLAWAVVTNYTWDNVWYKACVNFYKPYPIEIDADVEYEVNDFYKQQQEREEYKDKRMKEIFIKKVKNEGILSDDHLKMLDYLWIDIIEEVVSNMYEVNELWSPSGSVKETLEKIVEEAEKKVEEETLIPLDSEYSQRKEWNTNLMGQLAGNMREKTYTYSSSIYNPSLYDTSKRKSWNSRDDYDDLSNSRADYDFWQHKKHSDTLFNNKNFPTEDVLFDSLGLDTGFEVKLNDEWDRMIFNFDMECWEYVWDVINDLYEYQEDYLPKEIDDEMRLAN